MEQRSRFGLASIILWAALFAANGVAIAVFFYLAVFSGRNMNQPHGLDAAILVIVGTIVLASPLGNLAGVGLGVAALVRREPGWVAAVAGIALNGLTLSVALLVVILSFLVIGV